YTICIVLFCFFFSSRRRHTRSKRDWSSDVCSSVLVQETLQFSIFPSLLLLLTLFRLGLNVSTTRSILSKAEAGGVVDTFGSFVIGDNPLVGFVVFIILVIIQFI